MFELPSQQFMETYNFTNWAAKNWKLFANLYGLQCCQTKEPDEAFLQNSIEKIEFFKKESYHLCVLMYALENIPSLSDSVYTAFFETAVWLMDEKRIKYFERHLLDELKKQLKARQYKGIELP